MKFVLSIIGLLGMTVPNSFAADAVYEKKLIAQARQLLQDKKYQEAYKLLDDDMDGPAAVTTTKLILCGFAAMANNDTEAATSKLTSLKIFTDDKAIRRDAAVFLLNNLRGAGPRTLAGHSLKPGEGYQPGPQGERYTLVKAILEIDPSFKNQEAVAFGLYEVGKVSKAEFLRRFPNGNYAKYVDPNAKPTAAKAPVSTVTAAERAMIAQVKKKEIVTKHFNIGYWDYQCQGLIVYTKSSGGLHSDKTEPLAKAYLAKKGLNVAAMIKAKRLVFEVYCPD